MRLALISALLMWPVCGHAEAFITRDPVTHELTVQHECTDYQTWMQRRCVGRPGFTPRPDDPACQDFKELTLICAPAK